MSIAITDNEEYTLFECPTQMLTIENASLSYIGSVAMPNMVASHGR